MNKSKTESKEEQCINTFWKRVSEILKNNTLNLEKRNQQNKN